MIKRRTNKTNTWVTTYTIVFWHNLPSVIVKRRDYEYGRREHKSNTWLADY